jgi:hypothetical protein
LRPGAVVVLRVIKSLDPIGDAPGAVPRRWAVGIGGKVYPAVTDLPLEPGATLRARVTMAQGKLVLSTADVPPEPAAEAVRSVLASLGAPTGSDAELVALALARAGLPLQAETIRKVLALLQRTGIDAKTGARAAATLVDRGFDPSGGAARSLLPVLTFGQRGGEDHRRYRGRELPRSPRAVKDFAGGLAVDPGPVASALQAYNHTRAGSQTWIVIPYVFEEGSGPSRRAERIAGTIRILYDVYASRPLALSLVAGEISFHLPLQGKTRRLSVFCPEPLKGVVSRALDSARPKFHNMGLEVDDTVNGGDGFDGFTPVEALPGFSGVDTLR